MGDAQVKATKAKAAAPETTGEKRKPSPPVEHQFKPGNPGRPKGSRNKLGEAFIAAMHDDFTEHGPAVIAQVRAEKPDQYLKVIASILPQQLNVNVQPLDELSDDQLRKHAEALLRELGPVLAFASGGDASGSSDPKARKPLN